jgi:hypothetical protein
VVDVVRIQHIRPRQCLQHCIYRRLFPRGEQGGTS